MIKQGEIYLANFGNKYNSEIGKIRPAVVMQNNFLNKSLPKAKYKGVLLIPLTSDDIVTEYKIKITKRDRLQKDSYILT
jgi:mRNA interferase MazF